MKPKLLRRRLYHNHFEMSDSLLWAFEIIKKAFSEKFYGSITINFYGGGITNIERNESLKPPGVVKVTIIK